MDDKKIKFNESFQWNLNEGSIWWGSGTKENCLSFSFPTKKLKTKFIEAVTANKEYINCYDDEKKYEMTYYDDHKEKKDILSDGMAKYQVYSIDFFYKEISK